MFDQNDRFPYSFIYLKQGWQSLRVRGQRFPWVTMNVAPGYFHREIDWRKNNRICLLVVFTQHLEILVTALNMTPEKSTFHRQRLLVWAIIGSTSPLDLLYYCSQFINHYPVWKASYALPPGPDIPCYLFIYFVVVDVIAVFILCSFGIFSLC